MLLHKKTLTDQLRGATFPSRGLEGTVRSVGTTHGRSRPAEQQGVHKRHGRIQRVVNCGGDLPGTPPPHAAGAHPHAPPGLLSIDARPTPTTGGRPARPAASPQREGNHPREKHFTPARDRAPGNSRCPGQRADRRRRFGGHRLPGAGGDHFGIRPDRRRDGARRPRLAAAPRRRRTPVSPTPARPSSSSAKQSCLALKRDGIHPMVATRVAGRDPGGRRLRPLPAAVGLQPDLGLGRRRRRPDHRDRRRVRRPERGQPTWPPTARRRACPPAPRQLLQEGQPERRDLPAAGHGADQRRLDAGGVARPGHGLGDLPAVPHHPGRGQPTTHGDLGTRA